jgi:hypothetical protein
MPAVAARPEAIHMRFITPQVESAVEQLPPPERLKAVRALGNPVRRQRCAKLVRLRRYGLWHFDVTRSIRVTYRVLDGSACVLHVGTHPEFDQFVDHYSGIVPTQLISIKESIVMKKHMVKTGTSSPNGVRHENSATQPVGTASEAALGVNPKEVPEVLHPLLNLFGAAIAEACRQKVSGDIESMRDLVREELGAEAQQQADDLARLGVQQEQLVRQLAAQQSAHTAAEDSLTKDLRAVTQHVSSVQTAWEAAQAEVRQGLNVVSRDQDELRNEAMARVVALAAKVEKLTEMHKRDSVISRNRIAAIAADLDSLASAVSEEQGVVASLNCRLDQLAAVTDATKEAVEAAVAAFRDELTSIKAAHSRRAWRNCLTRFLAVVRHACAGPKAIQNWCLRQSR